MFNTVLIILKWPVLQGSSSTIQFKNDSQDFQQVISAMEVLGINVSFFFKNFIDLGQNVPIFTFG